MPCPTGMLHSRAQRAGGRLLASGRNAHKGGRNEAYICLTLFLIASPGRLSHSPNRLVDSLLLNQQNCYHGIIVT